MTAAETFAREAEQERITRNVWIGILREQAEVARVYHGLPEGQNVLELEEGRISFRHLVAVGTRRVKVDTLRSIARSLGIDRLGTGRDGVVRALTSFYISSARHPANELVMMRLAHMEGVVERTLNDEWTTTEMTLIDGRRVRVTVEAL